MRTMNLLEDRSLNFPIYVLLDDVLKQFEALCNKYQLQDSINNGLSQKIKLYLSDSTIDEIAHVEVHYNDLNEQKFEIGLYDNYCQFIWSLAYASLIVMDEELIKPLREDDPNEDHKKIAFEVLIKAFELFDKTKEISKSSFYNLSNPIDDKFDEYVKASNVIFSTALSFILLHEFMHVYNGDVHNHYPNKDEELAADLCAYFSMIERDVLDKRNIAFGCIIALLSLFFADNTLSGGETHPDSDDRLFEIIELLCESLGPEDLEYCSAYTVTLIKIWYWNSGAEIKDFPDPKSFQSFVDYLDHIKDFLRVYKSKF